MKRLADRDRKAILIAAAGGALLVAAAVLAVFGWRSSGDPEDGIGSEAPEASVAVREPADPSGFRLDAFDEDLISYLCRNGYESASFVVSPAALRASLGAAALGAQGNTRTELAQAAGFPGLDAFGAWRAGLEALAPGAAVCSVWSDEDEIGRFTDSYARGAKEAYCADALACGPDEMTDIMSGWLGGSTDGAIGAVGQDMYGAASVLLSAPAIRAAWEEAFSAAQGYEGSFGEMYGAGSVSGFMEWTGECLYADDGVTRAVALPLEGDLYLVCFSGSRTDRFAKVADMRSKVVHVVLPAFDLASSFGAADMSGFLLSRGASEALDPLAANFYNMCQGGDWFIQEIAQEARFEAGPGGAGTSAPELDAARASAGADAGAAVEFVADGPFSFAIFAGFGTNSQYMLLYGQLA